MDRKAAYWSQFKDAMELRNGLTHPKGPAVVTEASVERALLAILQLLDVTYMRVYGKKYPGGSVVFYRRWNSKSVPRPMHAACPRRLFITTAP